MAEHFCKAPQVSMNWRKARFSLYLVIVYCHSQRAQCPGGLRPIGYDEARGPLNCWEHPSKGAVMARAQFRSAGSEKKGLGPVAGEGQQWRWWVWWRRGSGGVSLELQVACAFGIFYPTKRSQWETCTRWLSFGFLFSAAKQFRLTSKWRALPLATLVWLVMDSSDFVFACFCGTSLNVMPQRFQSNVLAEVSKIDQKGLLHGLFNVPSIQKCLWCSQSCMIRE